MNIRNKSFILFLGIRVTVFIDVQSVVPYKWCVLGSVVHHTGYHHPNCSQWPAESQTSSFLSLCSHLLSFTLRWRNRHACWVLTAIGTYSWWYALLYFGRNKSYFNKVRSKIGFTFEMRLRTTSQCMLGTADRFHARRVHAGGFLNLVLGSWFKSRNGQHSNLTHGTLI